jgi:hypothetical protein
MLHLLAESIPEPRPQPYAEALSRLASVRHALRLVEPFGAGPASDLGDDEALAAAWSEAGEARTKLFDKRSAKLVGATAAGVEALLTERDKGNAPHPLASNELVEQIRRELSELAHVVLP